MIQTFTEPAITDEVRDQLRPLLDEAFPALFNGRTYVKQRPHFRIIMRRGSEIIGHVALDYRIIRIGDGVVPICFVIDLCVRKDLRGQGVGSKLLAEAELQARGSSACFMVLMADIHEFYGRYGFLRIQGVSARYLSIDNLVSSKLMEEDLSSQLMAKNLTEVAWPQGPIDMLGYLP